MYDFISIANKLYPEIKDEYYNNQKRLIDKANAEFTARKERNCLGRGSFYRDYSDIGSNRILFKALNNIDFNGWIYI